MKNHIVDTLNADMLCTIQADIDNFLDSFLSREHVTHNADRHNFRHDWYALEDEYAFNFAGN